MKRTKYTLLDLVRERMLVIILSSVLHTNEIGSQIVRVLKQKKQMTLLGNLIGREMKLLLECVVGKVKESILWYGRLVHT